MADWEDIPEDEMPGQWQDVPDGVPLGELPPVPTPQEAFLRGIKEKALDVKIFMLIILCLIFARNTARNFNRYFNKGITKVPIQTKKSLIKLIINTILFILCAYFINAFIGERCTNENCEPYKTNAIGVFYNWDNYLKFNKNNDCKYYEKARQNVCSIK